MKITAADVAKLLNKPSKKSAGEWTACCPAHNDKNPSLSIKDGDKDEPILFCHAGCEFQEIIKHIKNWPDKQTGHFDHPSQQHNPFATNYFNPRRYIYRDETGTAKYMVERAYNGSGKTFKQYTLDKNYNAKPGIKDTLRLPYQLKYFKDQDFVYICEGEQSVDALLRYGYPATCNSGGANNWDTNLNQYFKDKNVIIIPDNDKAGHKHALNVASQLHKTAKQITIANVCNNLNEKDDIVDWFYENSNDIYNLNTIVTQYPEWHLGDEIDDLNTFIKDDYSAKSWLDKVMQPRDYLMGTLLCTTSRWMIYAPTGLGKTLFTMNMMAAVASGAQFLNWRPGRKSSVLYIDGEMPAETFKERIIQVTNLFGKDIDLIGINRDDEASKNNEMPPLNTEDGVKWLKHKIRYTKPDLIAFDSIMCLLSGDMKDEESWEPIKSLMKWLTNQRIAQIWIHHTGHAEGKSYGSNTREGELDTVLRLERPPADEEGFIINFTKNRLRTHENAADFERIHCQLTPVGWTATLSVKSGNKKSDDRSNFSRAIDEIYKNLAYNRQPNGVGYNNTAVVKISRADLRDQLVNRGYVELPDGKKGFGATDRKKFQRALIDLQNENKYTFDKDNIWKI